MRTDERARMECSTDVPRVNDGSNAHLTGDGDLCYNSEHDDEHGETVHPNREDVKN